MWSFAVLLLCGFAAVQANVSPGDITYFLTNYNTRYQQIRTGELDSVPVDAAKEVKVISHGWVDDIDAYWYEPTKDNYLRASRANIIAIDWSPHAEESYLTAVRRLEDVAFHVANKLLEFSDVNNIPLSRFHLIGHSLGAHLFGFVGQHIFAARGERVGRITGLDPAGPLFENRDPSGRISDDDADFVDIMHTDGGQAGIRRSVGHIDYFPNGGVARQNGCGILAIGCSHNRATHFFYESIISNGFITVQCGSVRDFDQGRCNDNPRTVMGENVDRNLRGDFYLNTNSRAPFARGQL